MLAKVLTCAVIGLDGALIEVEAGRPILAGPPTFASDFRDMKGQM